MKSLVKDAKTGTLRRCESSARVAVIALQLCAEGFVALQNVEHVAQHFKHHAIGLCPHRRRPRVITHAGHFAEQVARA